MQNLRRLVSVAGSCLAAALLAACNGGPSGQSMAVPPGTAPAGMTNLATTVNHSPPHPIFVADNGGKLVKEIPRGCLDATCVVTVGKGYSCPTTVSLDKSLDLYVSNTCDYGTAIYKMTPGCGNESCASIVPGDYLNPWGTASDKQGNLYVADYSHGYVKKVPAGCGGNACVVTLGGKAFVGPGYYPWDYGPSDVTLDKHRNVYVSSDYYVSEMPHNCRSSSCVTRLGGGWGQPNSVSLDRHNNIYIADDANKSVKEMQPSCRSASCVSTILGGFNDPWSAKADAQGNVYVSDTGASTVSMIPTGCRSWSCVVTIGGGFSQPLGLAVGP
ncbi:MAG: NHL repeat-containing protein [Candidatus Cybelea sp.]